MDTEEIHRIYESRTEEETQRVEGYRQKMRDIGTEVGAVLKEMVADPTLPDAHGAVDSALKLMLAYAHSELTGWNTEMAQRRHDGARAVTALVNPNPADPLPVPDRRSSSGFRRGKPRATGSRPETRARGAGSPSGS